MTSKICKKFGVFKRHDNNCFYFDIDENCEIPCELKNSESKYLPGDYVYLMHKEHENDIIDAEYCKIKQIRGRVTSIVNHVFIINDECCYYASIDEHKNEIKIGVSGTCKLITGEYNIGQKSYDWRCISFIADVENNYLDDSKHSDTKSWVENVSNNNYGKNVLNENSKNRHKHDFEIPEDLYDLILNEKRETIIDKFDDILIKNDDINFDSYLEHFHTLIHIEEMYMVESIESFNRSKIYFKQKTSRDFVFECQDLFELRPSLACGDRVTASVAEPVDNSSKKYDGSIKRIEKESVVVRFEKEFVDNFEPNVAFDIKFISSRAQFIKMHRAIEYVHEHFGKTFLFPNNIQDKRTAQIDVVLKNENDMMLNDQKIEWLNLELNHYQKNAVVQVLRSECHPLPYIIFGPPGTGKTTTLVEAIAQTFLNQSGCRILVATHTNSAADLLTSKLLKYDSLKNHLIRLLGHNYYMSNKLSTELKKYCVRIRSQDATDNIIDDEIKVESSPRILDNYSIVISTNTSIGQAQGKSVKMFSHIFVDEAAQATEPETFIPFMLGDKTNTKIILAGDSKQMRPMVLSFYAIDAGLSISFFERIFDLYQFFSQNTESTNLNCDKSLGSLLLLNYRSLPSILNIFNSLFYDSLLQPTISSIDSDEVNCLKKLHDRNFFTSSDNTSYSEFGIHFMNINGRNTQQDDSPSWMNMEEAKEIGICLCKLLSYGFSFDDIGVITPYRKQANFIHDVCKARNYTCKVGSVEEFQGLERKIILVSTVRTNVKLAELDIKRGMGIISCSKRLNVIISRARALVLIFGKEKLLRIDRNWDKLIDYCKQNNTYYANVKNN